MLLAAGFVDAWSLEHPGTDGFTCCQAETLDNDPSALDQRLDLVLFRGGFQVRDVELVGEEDADRTESGLWPSDHAGVVSTLVLP
jgi:hypothetical protein